MTRSRMVTQLRQYSVIDVQGAKDVAMIWLEKANLQNAITFGLPEVDDRYHVWRVPLLNQLFTGFRDQAHHPLGWLRAVT